MQIPVPLRSLGCVIQQSCQESWNSLARDVVAAPGCAKANGCKPCTHRMAAHEANATAGEDEGCPPPADSDCIEILPSSSAVKLEGDASSYVACNSSAIQQKPAQQQQQSLTEPKSEPLPGMLQTGITRGADPASIRAPAAHHGSEQAVSAQPATLLKQLGKGRKGQGGLSLEDVQVLLAMGFTEVQAKKALQNCSHNVERAANWLLAGT